MDILIHKTSITQLDLKISHYQFSPKLIENLSRDLMDGVPLAVLMGFSEFYGHRFFVNSNVLIPRPETEQMVDILVKKFQSKKVKRILDVGTGSGVIILSLLKQEVGVTGVASDLSAPALEVAKINSRRLKLEDKCEFTISDRLDNIAGEFDLIVSNPPYIKASLHRSLVHVSVDKHEPDLALFLTDEEYDNWFNQFFLQIKSHLAPGGTFMMEGHELELAKQQVALSGLGFPEVTVIQDFSGRDRFILSSAH